MTPQEFKILHKRFADALKYLMENEQKLKADPERWKKVQKNFEQKFEAPLDKAWLELSKEERKRLGPLYLHRKAQEEPIVKEVLKTFKGRIISVTEAE